jgi:valyl-tRNA synthetase
LKVEQKVKVPIEVFAHQFEIGRMIDENRDAIERLANVEAITLLEGSFSTMPGARSTARFDVHVIYERKIDVAVELERLKKELEQIEKEIVNCQRDLSNERFVAKAPPQVVEGKRQRLQELEILREKVKSKLDELK